MIQKPLLRVAALAAVTGLAASVASAITIPTVPVGNLGNAADPLTGNLYGSVAYGYSIGTTEVTNAQYAAFLNAVAVADTFNCYNVQMAGSFGGITRTGSPGAYSYTTVSGRENNPVTYVSFWDSCRFANWMHNGQPSGAQSNATTEDGAYLITSLGIAFNNITRNAGWKWAVASENEWYKAAYHQPAAQGGDSDNYWLFPTASNTVNTSQANYSSVIGNTTPVGSYAANFYGAFDMGGNVFEWNEAIIFSSRGSRGGSWFNGVNDLRADVRNNFAPNDEFGTVGFRLVQVPGPAPIALLALGGVAAGRRRR